MDLKKHGWNEREDPAGSDGRTGIFQATGLGVEERRLPREAKYLKKLTARKPGPFRSRSQRVSANEATAGADFFRRRGAAWRRGVKEAKRGRSQPPCSALPWNQALGSPLCVGAGSAPASERQACVLCFTYSGEHPGSFRMSPLYQIAAWSFGLGCPSPSPLRANTASRAAVNVERPRRAKISAKEGVAAAMVIVLGPETLSLAEMQNRTSEHRPEPRAPQ